jgi:NAD(P)H-hydrate epimerase
MDIAELLEDADSVLIGPGLGRSETAKNLIKRVLLKTTRPTVIDADGINAISADINILGKVKAPIILTPHPAEMARLCKTTVSDIEQNRISYSREFAKKFDCTVVLKGANTIVASNLGKVFFNTVGNAGMARGGSGDVLSGVITAYLGMGMNPLNAAIEGVYNHSLAGDMARDKYSERGMLPTDIIECLKTIT